MPGHGGRQDPDDDRDRIVDMNTIHISENDTNTTRSAFDLFDPNLQFSSKVRGQKMHLEPKIFDQGDINSCGTNALASAYLYALQRQGVKADYTPSRLFLYYVSRIPDQIVQLKDPKGRGLYYASLATTDPSTNELIDDDGTYTRENLRIMANLGAPQESLLYDPAAEQDKWPYTHLTQTQAEYNALPEPDKTLARAAVQDKLEKTALAALRPHRKAFENAVKHTAVHYAAPANDKDCWKSCISNGYPIIFTLRETTQFTDAVKKHPYVPPTPTTTNKLQPDGGHTVLAVGWDDDKVWQNDANDTTGGKGCFRIQNSWGSAGDNGFFWMPYEWIGKNFPNITKWGELVHTAWVIVDSEDQLGPAKKDAP